MTIGIANLTAETVIGFLGIFVGTVASSALWYWKNYRSPEPARKVAESLVMSSGVIADMAPVREAAAALNRIAHVLERAQNTMDDELEERRRLRHVLDEIRQCMEGSAQSVRTAENRSHRQEERG
ncbi:MAG: hypothetical protein Q8M31_18480 [Beijerinckiaceae bacterium]|nr:hypothetical protein [Beijerinckiaceae bacterium]